MDIDSNCPPLLFGENYSAKTKRDGQTDGGALQYLPSRAFGAAGDKNCFMVEFGKRDIGGKIPSQTSQTQQNTMVGH